MAIWTFPLKSINGSNMYSDKDFRRFYANIFSSGIIPNVDLEGNLSLQVLQTETPSMNIRVGPGVDMINGGHIMNTAIKEFPIPAPLTTQERIDCIVAQWNDSTNSGDIIYKKNTTQIVRSQDIWEHKLAEIVVPANATSISQANITDTRANPDVCGYSSPFEKIDVGDLAAQFKALTDEYNLEFQAWFENLKNQLDDNQAANLQNQIDTINGVIVQKNIPDGANLDEYKAEGEFSKKTPTIVGGAPKDVSGAFRLSVRTMLGSTAFFQRLYDYGTASTYIRFANYNGWKPWQKLITADETGTVKVQDIEISGSVTRPSKSILWAGAFYMSDLHKISPAKSLSECENGWILHFTEYTAGMNGNTKNAFNHYINVPKEHLDLAQAGTVFPLMSPGSTPTVAVKYLYIRDGEVAGHSMNQQGNNTKFVLQHVLEY
ncbi:pyocin knob domain-containing protein [Lactococcus garvieae]|uniref:pyocin knob domain-containing protein n=1 Tax=Lactococcus garvieae TaxID=1363 RepID=UPI0032E43226